MNEIVSCSFVVRYPEEGVIYSKQAHFSFLLGFLSLLICFILVFDRCSSAVVIRKSQECKGLRIPNSSAPFSFKHQ